MHLEPIILKDRRKRKENRRKIQGRNDSGKVKGCLLDKVICTGQTSEFAVQLPLQRPISLSFRLRVSHCCHSFLHLRCSFFFELACCRFSTSYQASLNVLCSCGQLHLLKMKDITINTLRCTTVFYYGV